MPRYSFLAAVAALRTNETAYDAAFRAFPAGVPVTTREGDTLTARRYEAEIIEGRVVAVRVYGESN